MCGGGEARGAGAWEPRAWCEWRLGEPERVGCEERESRAFESESEDVKKCDNSVGMNGGLTAGRRSD